MQDWVVPLSWCNSNLADLQGRGRITRLGVWGKQWSKTVTLRFATYYLYFKVLIRSWSAVLLLVCSEGRVSKCLVLYCKGIVLK